MEEKKTPLANHCNFMTVKPIMMDLPSPPVQVAKENLAYANLLSIDYCGGVSELTAITQYINHENRLFCQRCPIAKTLLGIAMAEMMHLQKLGELIYLLGGSIDYVAKYRNGQKQMWTPGFVSLQSDLKGMLEADIQAEKEAINQYWRHMQAIKDNDVNAVLDRIIKDEEYHIMVLQALMEE